MASTMAYNKRPRHHPEENNEQKTKRLHTIKPVLHLTDLNDDVLFEICQHLKFEDLIALVKASEMFTGICWRALSRIIKGVDVGKMKIPLGGSEMDFQRSVQLLHCFGKFTTCVTLDYACLSISGAKEIHNLFVESCHESVTEIQLTRFLNIWEFHKCFPKLKTLIIHFGCVNRLMWEIETWFPRVEYLFICSYTNIAETMNARGSIPSLKNVWIHSYPVQDLNLFIMRNPQLKIFYLNSCEYLESDIYNIWAMKAVDNVRNDVELSVSLELRDFASVRQLMVPDDRVTQLNLKEFYFRTIKNCDFVTNFFNLKTFNMTKILRPYQSIDVHDLYAVVIHPLVNQCKKLNSLKITYQRYNGRSYNDMAPFRYDHWKQEVNGYKIALFDKIETHVQLNRWEFSSKVSPHGVSFMLNKQV